MNSESSLRLYQKKFKSFLLESTTPSSEFLRKDIAVHAVNKNVTRKDFAQQRLTIYRNNVLYSLSRALGDLYPVTRRVVGDDCFYSVAKEYVLICPPVRPELSCYGEGFVEFIGESESCKGLVYLKDVARLEWYCQRTLHEADAQILDAAILLYMNEESLVAQTFLLHPAVVFMESIYPVDRIWEENQKQVVGAVDISKHDKCYLLIYRKELQVQVVNLQPTVYHLLCLLGSGKEIGAAWGLAKELAGEDALGDEKFSEVLVYIFGLGCLSNLCSDSNLSDPNLSI